MARNDHLGRGGSQNSSVGAEQNFYPTNPNQPLKSTTHFWHEGEACG